MLCGHAFTPLYLPSNHCWVSAAILIQIDRQYGFDHTHSQFGRKLMQDFLCRPLSPLVRPALEPMLMLLLEQLRTSFPAAATCLALAEGDGSPDPRMPHSAAGAHGHTSGAVTSSTVCSPCSGSKRFQSSILFQVA